MENENDRMAFERLFRGFVSYVPADCELQYRVSVYATFLAGGHLVGRNPALVQYSFSKHPI